jgi:hypothetical protein
MVSTLLLLLLLLLLFASPLTGSSTALRCWLRPAKNALLLLRKLLLSLQRAHRKQVQASVRDCSAKLLRIEITHSQHSHVLNHWRLQVVEQVAHCC